MPYILVLSSPLPKIKKFPLGGKIKPKYIVILSTAARSSHSDEAGAFLMADTIIR
jgi:hypothetical protein